MLDCQKYHRTWPLSKVNFPIIKIAFNTAQICLSAESFRPDRKQRLSTASAVWQAPRKNEQPIKMFAAYYWAWRRCELPESGRDIESRDLNKNNNDDLVSPIVEQVEP